MTFYLANQLVALKFDVLFQANRSVTSRASYRQNYEE